MHAERLDVPADQVGAVGGGRGEHAERDRVGADDQQRADTVGQFGQLPTPGLDHAVHGGRLQVEGGEGVVQPHLAHLPGVGHRGEVHLDVRGEVVADLGQLVGRDRPTHQHLGPSGAARGHPQGRPGRLVAVVDGDVDDVHLQQLGHHRDVLEEGLEAAVVLVGLARVGGEELAATVDLVAHRRDVVVVAAVAEEAEQFGRVGVACQQAVQVPDQAGFVGVGRGQVERAVEPQVGGDVAVELGDVGGADLGEHRRPGLGPRVGDVGMGHWHSSGQGFGAASGLLRTGQGWSGLFSTASGRRRRRGRATGGRSAADGRSAGR